MNKIYLFALFIAVASANLAVDIGNVYLPCEAFKCLSDHQVSKVIIQILNEMGVTNIDFLTHLTDTRDAGISEVDATVIVNDSFAADSLSTKVAGSLPSGFSGTVWLQVISSPQLWTKSTILRIPYLGDLVTSFRQRGLKVGVSADSGTWTSVFGLKHAGSDNLKSASLWYAYQDGGQSFDDFSTAGFGTWTQPALKNFQSHITFCGTGAPSFNYYEGDTQLDQIHQ